MNAIKIRNYIALFLIGLAKVCGMGGVACAFAAQYTFGKTLLFSSGICIMLAIILAIINSYAFEKVDEKNVDFLRKMMEEGTLRDHLKQIGYR